MKMFDFTQFRPTKHFRINQVISTIFYPPLLEILHPQGGGVKDGCRALVIWKPSPTPIFYPPPLLEDLHPQGGGVKDGGYDLIQY